MVFSSFVFLFVFLPTTLLGYLFCEKKIPKSKNAFIFIASMFFYAWGEPRYILLLILSIVFNYGLARWIDRTREKRILAVGILINVATLFVFKYLNFFIVNINELCNIELTNFELELPIGISFYTFQMISYLIDVYRRSICAQRNIINFGMYISFFPQLIAGPIVRYSDIENQINDRVLHWDGVCYGALGFMLGFAKKVLLADQIAYIADYAFSLPNNDMLLAWMGMAAYTLQIYFDFSGYSDMAIGLGAMFGFQFNENFNMPYKSLSITEFWRRWHMSLSSWFKDYVYIPLGGSRCTPQRNNFNLFVVFALTGFWHGASWNFCLWGIYYAFILILEKRYLYQWLEKRSKGIKHIYTILVVMIGWVIFRSNTLKEIGIYLKNLVSFSFLGCAALAEHISLENIFFLGCGIFLCIFEKQKIVMEREKCGLLFEMVIIGCFLIAIVYMMGKGFSPFLYFRF